MFMMMMVVVVVVVVVVVGAGELVFSVRKIIIKHCHDISRS